MFSKEDRYRLEHIFANNFNTPSFPILADLYFQNEEYQRSKKVCKIGLQKNPNNFHGKLILSKLYIVENKLLKAEKLLKNIVELDSLNIKAIIMLINLEISLKRSIITIKKYISLAYRLTPSSQEIELLYKKYFKESKIIRSKKTKNKIHIEENENFIINKAMFTQTMYRLMVKQNKFDIAYQILNNMKKTPKNKIFIKKEKIKLEKRKKNNVIS